MRRLLCATGSLPRFRAVNAIHVTTSAPRLEASCNATPEKMRLPSDQRVSTASACCPRLKRSPSPAACGRASARLMQLSARLSARLVQAKCRLVEVAGRSALPAIGAREREHVVRRARVPRTVSPGLKSP